jgi:hypothetical protein
MRRSRLGFVLVLAVAATLMLGVVPANAAIFDVHATDYDAANGRVVDVFGFIDCSEGQQFLLRVNVTDESGNKAIGRASGVCGGGPGIQGGNGGGTPWTTGKVESETGFTQGECLLARGRARTPDDQQTFTDFIGDCNGNEA